MKKEKFNQNQVNLHKPNLADYDTIDIYLKDLKEYEDNMEKINSNLIKKIVKRNNYNYNLIKASEELTELSLALQQHLTKKHSNSKTNIIEEIGDVKIRIKMLEEIFDKDKIKRRVQFKLNKYKQYLEQNKYRNI